MTSRNPLTTYRGKRHFGRTREPQGRRAASGDAPRFVLQIHDARTLHFDFRWEVDGVRKSWSVPKGSSADPQDKPVAMRTEDHPLEYRDCEGAIAAGECGAGTVIVWDEGSYRPLPGKKGPSRTFSEALERGHASFWLDGSKLHGGYAPTRFRGGGPWEREPWLLAKEGGHWAGRRGTPDARRSRPVRSGRTLSRVTQEEAGEQESA
ncbi:DNA polymerase ligase N-terminal domain-containing protein [Streptomyces decoyicus]|uniref:DNA polymerase ligase N-terminal domain-containing protein n=1 Tax=Streptomyces decoyicus TaxID=249567 RepID=UPI0004AB3BDF|nr:DNA polymerase ligase N-terminal domain-containing protein [Streptomyces decoyicus]KOG41141.1 3'-phosphoesterase [Streptomyces decoyicus]QZY20037.1 3'-phosphoesterase [Streptomyces decoyicus]